MALDPQKVIAAWRVLDVMSAPIRLCPPDLPLQEAAELMADERIHCLAVVDVPEDPAEDDRLIGLLSALDLVAALDASSPPASVAELVTTELQSVTADAPLAEAVRQMHESRIPHLVVVAKGSGRPVGLLSTLDILRALAELKDTDEAG
jgi:CBS domain-containing protein